MGWKDRLLIGKHYRMERFCAMFLSLTVALAATLGVALAQSLRVDDASLRATPLYTKSFTTSRTGVTGEVVGAFVNEARTRCFVMLKVADVSRVSTQADNYQMFLTWADVSPNPRGWLSQPSGAWFVFGTSGYMGALLTCEEGFPVQVLDLVVRCNSELARTTARSTHADASFDEYDQLQVFFNPGASGAQAISALDGDDLDVSRLFHEVVIVPQEAEARDELDASLETMKVDLQVIEEYEARVYGQDGVLRRERPAYVGDDAVTGEEGALALRTKTVAPGGWDFDWRGGSIEQGYLDALLPSKTMGYETYLASMSGQANEPIEGSDTEGVWELADGGSIEALNTGDASKGRYAQIKSDCAGLDGAWSSYMAEKANYQRKLLRRLLELEYEASVVEGVTTARAGEGTLTLY